MEKTNPTPNIEQASNEEEAFKVENTEIESNLNPLAKLISLFANKKTIIVVLLLLLVVSGVAALYSYKSTHSSTSEIIPDETPVHETEFSTTLTSVCGYEISLPTTSYQDGETSREWVYEEIQMGSDQFKKLAPDSVTRNGVMHTSMLFISDDKKIEEEEVLFDRGSGLLSFCVNNTDEWDLDEFVQHAQDLQDDQLNITVSEENSSWGELTLRQVNLEGVLNGGLIKGPYYLAVVGGNEEGANSRLVLFQPWSSNEEVVEADRLAMLDSLKSKQMTSPIEFKNEDGEVVSSDKPVSSGSSCEQLTIYEGKFKSDKCYSEKDYNELVYYLRQYSSAISSQNAAARGSQITCSGSEFFADECEEDKAQYEAALAKQAELEPIILGIIERGS